MNFHYSELFFKNTYINQALVTSPMNSPKMAQSKGSITTSLIKTCLCLRSLISFHITVDFFKSTILAQRIGDIWNNIPSINKILPMALRSHLLQIYKSYWNWSYPNASASIHQDIRASTDISNQYDVLKQTTVSHLNHCKYSRDIQNIVINQFSRFSSCQWRDYRRQWRLWRRGRCCRWPWRPPSVSRFLSRRSQGWSPLQPARQPQGSSGCSTSAQSPGQHMSNLSNCEICPKIWSFSKRWTLVPWPGCT